jgi:hypothetical protein
MSRHILAGKTRLLKSAETNSKTAKNRVRKGKEKE